LAAVTLTAIVQDELAPTPPFDNVTVPPAAVTDPLQLLVRLFGEATVNPAGRVSVNATPVCAEAFGFVIWKVSVL
jgi:hypothetical protein